MHLCLFEDATVRHFHPLTDTRAVYDLRVGVRTLGRTIADAFDGVQVLGHTRPAVAEVTAQENDWLINRLPDGLDVLFVNGRVVADGEAWDAIVAAAKPGEPGRVWMQGDDVVAAWVPGASAGLIDTEFVARETFGDLPDEQVDGVRLVGRLWHLLEEIAPGVEREFRHATRGYNTLSHDEANVQTGAILASPDRIYLAPGATIRPGAILSATDGPIYVGEGATIHEGAILRGPVAVAPHAQVLPAGRVEGSIIGPVSKVGGEVHNTVVHSFSNKAHDGYLGDAYLGRWCNLGADTNNSNLRNDYGPVELWDAVEGRYVDTGSQFVGLFMGDHAKCAINTMFNTGTVIGVFCNLYGAGFPPRYVPNFTWGRPEKLVPYRIDKALGVAEAVMARRNVPLTPADRALLTALSEARG